MNFFLASIILCQAGLLLSCDVKNRLVKNLLKTYNPVVEPTNCTVKFGVSVLCSRFDQEDHELTTNVWERYIWHDDRLAWDPKDYDGVSELRLPAASVWKPDIKLYNTIKANEDRSDVNVVIHSDGSLIWIPVATYETICSGGNGSMTCPLKLGSWTYDSFKVDLQSWEGGAIDLDQYNTASCPLQVAKHTGKITRQLYQCCKEPYSSLDIVLTLKPKSGKF